MFGIAVALAMGSYWLFHYGYYFAKGAPISLLDDILPSRRATFLASIDYMRKAGPFTPLGTGPGAQTVPGTATGASVQTASGQQASTSQEILGAQVAAGG